MFRAKVRNQIGGLSTSQLSTHIVILGRGITTSYSQHCRGLFQSFFKLHPGLFTKIPSRWWQMFPERVGYGGLYFFLRSVPMSWMGKILCFFKKNRYSLGNLTLWTPKKLEVWRMTFPSFQSGGFVAWDPLTETENGEAKHLLRWTPQSLFLSIWLDA